MMRELLDIVTKYTTGEEAAQANFSSKAKAKTANHLSGDGGDDPTSSKRHRNRRTREQKHRGEEMVTVADRATRP
jgi:hypothetical protein